MTASTQHSNHLLEELVAEEIANQIDQIAEELQREGWPIAMVKRFMHVAVERLPELTQIRRVTDAPASA